MEEKKDAIVLAEKAEVLALYDTEAKRKLLHQMFAPNLSMDEYRIFMGMSKMAGANPYLREIWAVKYDKNGPAAAIFLGRDFFRKIAMDQPDYDGHITGVYHEKDDFKWNVADIIKDGCPQHEFSNQDRGKIVGAYCIVYKKGIRVPIYVNVKIEEYQKYKKDGKTLTKFWKEAKDGGQPATQLDKVAEAQGLRKSWTREYKGAYSEDEAVVMDMGDVEIIKDDDGFKEVVEGKVVEEKKPMQEISHLVGNDKGIEFTTEGTEPIGKDPVENLEQKLAEPPAEKKEPEKKSGLSFKGQFMTELGARYPGQKSMVEACKRLTGKDNLIKVTEQEAEAALKTMSVEEV